MLEKKFRILILSASLFVLHSCGTYRVNKTSEFVKIADLKSLNGNYIARSKVTKSNKNLSSLLQNFNINDEKADFVNLTFKEPDTVKLTYLADSKSGTLERELILKGVRKSKFLEIYFSKQQSFLPLIYSTINVRRIRIGQDKNGELLIMDFFDNSGNFLVFGAGSSSERACHYSKSDKYMGLLPTFINGKWGFSNSKKELVIAPKYDFVYAFNNNTAKVKRNGKWGIIDPDGTEIIPLEFDAITADYLYNKQPIYLVEKNNKKGIIDLLGKEIVPTLYDEIDRLYYPEFRLKLGDKYGFGTNEKVIIPAIYSEVDWFGTSDYVVAKRKGNIYLVDKEGFEYETELYQLKEVLFKNQTHQYKPILSSKRKINFDEQFSN